jgi:hypothetical protein
MTVSILHIIILMMWVIIPFINKWIFRWIILMIHKRFWFWSLYCWLKLFSLWSNSLYKMWQIHILFESDQLIIFLFLLKTINKFSYSDLKLFHVLIIIKKILGFFAFPLKSIIAYSLFNFIWLRNHIRSSRIISKNYLTESTCAFIKRW